MANNNELGRTKYKKTKIYNVSYVIIMNEYNADLWCSYNNYYVFIEIHVVE